MDSKLMIALAVTVICTSPMHAADETETARPWLAEPVNPLSEAVDPAKITESTIPPLPDAIVQPMPPSFRLAERAEDAAIDESLYLLALDSIDRGLAHLRRRQNDHGVWMATIHAAPTDQPDQASPASIAVTAMAIQGFAQRGHDTAHDATLRQAVQAILNARGEDGLVDGGTLSSYVTAAMVSGLASLEDHRFQEAVDLGLDSLTTHQWNRDEGIGARKDWFGGAGYGTRGRPDLSNTQAMLQAMHDAGMSPDEPAFQQAVVFLSRTQNLTSVNPSDWAEDDGGFIYTPANGGESMASEHAGEGRYGEFIPAGTPRSLRSYGSMTYAGFKSLIHAGLTEDDPRVKAAFNWIRTHYTFDENPGVGQQGLYYYYLAMARALRASQQPIIIDADGVSHDWRAELVQALLERQREDGSWINLQDRWMEGNDELVTVYAVLTLEELLKPAPLARLRRTDTTAP
jgi:squalene-hopene/tetraprenyl-beta-curcumene cyclase